MAEEFGLPHDRIILSAKVSSAPDLIGVYRALAARCDYPLHLGLTEAGMGSRGIVASTAGMAVLLEEGIGDTIRVSLTPRPGGNRAEEVVVAQQMLQALGLRRFAPQVSACPGCGRTTSTFLSGTGRAHSRPFDRKSGLPGLRSIPGVETLRVAVMGCIVNGPGESKHADIGISLPGTGEDPEGAGLRGWPSLHDSERASDCRGFHPNPRGLRKTKIWREMRDIRDIRDRLSDTEIP